MCAATVVVESPEAGGAMVTAAFADGYDRTVLAVPGRATDECSRGTNALIFNRKAQPVMSARDILHELMWDARTEGMLRPIFRTMRGSCCVISMPTP